MFAKRHYEAIAQAMQECHPGTGLSEDNRAVIQWNETVKTMWRLFMLDNPRFDGRRFERACQPGANVKSRKAA